MKAVSKRFALVLAVWTLVALCGGLADYLFATSIGAPASFWKMLRRPLTEQWIWALLTPLVFFVAHRFPLRRPNLLRATSLHIGAFLLLCVLHCLLAEAVGGPLELLPAHYTGSRLLLRFLEELYSDIWMYWPLVCIQALIDSQARIRQRDGQAAELETLLARSHLAFLRAQIQPHFLFNTLHALSGLIRSDSLAAEDMVADLAAILRASSADPDSQETTLQRELDLVACYLRIQQRRFGDRLRVNQGVAPELLQAAVPALVLQSLVENAVTHGIAPLDKGGTVEIRAYRRQDMLVLQVEDDGVGIRSAGRAGVGIANARRRLRELYGTRQSFDLAEGPVRGISVIVCIPYRILAPRLYSEAVSNEYTDIDSRRRSARPA